MYSDDIVKIKQDEEKLQRRYRYSITVYKSHVSFKSCRCSSQVSDVPQVLISLHLGVVGMIQEVGLMCGFELLKPYWQLTAHENSKVYPAIGLGKLTEYLCCPNQECLRISTLVAQWVGVRLALLLRGRREGRTYVLSRTWLHRDQD